MARSIVSVERGFVISYKGNADIIAEYPETFGLVNPNLEINKPSIIRAHSFVNSKFHRVPLTRENVFRRDGYECIYCGCSKRKDLTIDHVIPVSKGGKTSWDNLVTACSKCNGQKSDLTLKEFGKKIPMPKRPHYLMLIKKVHYIPDEWKEYLLY
jgi:hypothetical protein